MLPTKGATINVINKPYFTQARAVQVTLTHPHPSMTYSPSPLPFSHTVEV